MASSVPAASGIAGRPESRLRMLGPDFPFAYDEHLASPHGLGRLPPACHGEEVAIVGAGIAGMVCAYELMKLGLRPVVYEADQIGGRLRSAAFEGFPDVVAELGAMRFPPSSAAFFHYVDLLGLQTRPFPNPLTPAASSTVVDLKGTSHYARTLDDLPQHFREVARAWSGVLERAGAQAGMQEAIRAGDARRIKQLWNPLVHELDDASFYGFLAASPEFARFSFRETFGQVGFGTGGWDTDFPNSMLEILRVVHNDLDEDHQAIVGGCQQVPLGLWTRAPAAEELAHWPPGTTLASLHDGGAPRPTVRRLDRTAPANVTVADASGHIRTFRAAVVTPQSWILLGRVRCDETLFPADVWTAMERTHYMESSKTVAIVDRPFWLEPDPRTGRDPMSMTLTDRLPRSTYLVDDGRGRPAVVYLSYTWTDDALKWLPFTAAERLELQLQSLRSIYPDVDLRGHMVGDPITVSWESEPWFMGAFKANLPGHYRYQRRLFCHFVQHELPEEQRGVFLAGDDVSWTAGWAEGAIQTALNAVWGVLHHLGGQSHPDNPGPGDRFAELAPVALAED